MSPSGANCNTPASAATCRQGPGAGYCEVMNAADLYILQDAVAACWEATHDAQDLDPDRRWQFRDLEVQLERLAGTLEAPTTPSQHARRDAP